LTVAEALQQLESKVRELIAEHGPESVLLLGSNRASLETNWLLQRWAEQLGCRAPLLSAHLPRHQSAQVAAFDLADRLASLEKVRQSDLLVVIGVDPLAEAPMLAVALRQAQRNGGQVLAYDPRVLELPCTFEQQKMTPVELFALLDDDRNPTKLALLEKLKQAERPVLVAGGDLLGAGGLLAVQKLAVAASNAERSCLVHPVLGGANSFGAALLSLPEQDDLLTRLETGRIKMLVCFETDPLLEAPEGERFGKALSFLDELVVLDYLPTPLSVHANLFIPTSAPVETAGTFINNEGRQQLFAPVIEPRLPIAVTGEGDHPPREFSHQAPGSDPQPAWQLLQQLLGEETNLDQVRSGLKAAHSRLVEFSDLQPGGVPCRVADADERSLYADELPAQPAGTLQLIVSPARYGSDLLSRFSDKLQPRFASTCLQLHPQDATELGLTDGMKVVLITDIGKYNLSLCLRDDLTPGCAVVENGSAFPHLVPGGKLQFCRIEAGGNHD
jgi:NADH-quinone oxidoreductase subunit G